MELLWKVAVIALTCVQLSAGISNYRYYPRYHFAPVNGWMNDPNGFCEYNGEYHMFYQYNPYSSLEPGIAVWGHTKSKDLFHWVDLGIAIQNNSAYDAQGVYSGTIVVESDIMYAFYTSNVKYTDRTPDHKNTESLAISKDGENFTKYENNPIIDISTLEPDIRDPKVWTYDDDYYMVLGNSFTGENNQSLGRILLFESSDKVNWTQVSVMEESDGSLGYMWECPDFFEIDGHYILLFSPQGIERQGDRFKNLYQVGYFVGYFDYESKLFTAVTEFELLDFGHDFYATQTMLDSSGRRLLVGWMDGWEYSYPERYDNFTGQMTMMRTLYLNSDNRLCQLPVDEVESLRTDTLYSGDATGNLTVELPDKAGEVYIRAPCYNDFNLFIGSDNASVEVKYEYLKGRVSVIRDATDAGLRRTKYRALDELKIRIFIDASSIEVFFGEGEVTFSTRYFIDDVISVTLGTDAVADEFIVYALETSLYTT